MRIHVNFFCSELLFRYLHEGIEVSEETLRCANSFTDYEYDDKLSKYSNFDRSSRTRYEFILRRRSELEVKI